MASEYSKLFMESSKSVESEGKWGTGEVGFDAIQLNSSVLTEDVPELVITTKIKAKKNVDMITCGFSIKNAAGVPVLGTNNVMQGQSFGVTTDETVTLVWKVPNIFSDGSYDIAFALEGDGVVFDWRDEELSFDVRLQDRTSFMLTPPIVLERE